MAYDIILKLQMIINTANDGDISANIAKALLESIYTDIESLSIGELAERGYTSISTISRFAKSLDCDSFNELKKKCIERKKIGKEIIEDNLENMKFDHKDDKDILIQFTESITSDLKDFVENIDLENVDSLVELIHNHKEVNFFGIQLSGYFVEHLQYLFLNIGKYINFRLDEISQEKLARETGENSLSIIFSVDGNFLHSRGSMFYDIRDNKGKVVLITQNPALKISNKCDKVIYLGSYTSPKNGRYKLQLFTEILINRYYLKYQDEIKM